MTHDEVIDSAIDFLETNKLEYTVDNFTKALYVLKLRREALLQIKKDEIKLLN